MSGLHKARRHQGKGPALLGAGLEQPLLPAVGWLGKVGTAGLPGWAQAGRSWAVPRVQGLLCGTSCSTCPRQVCDSPGCCPALQQPGCTGCCVVPSGLAGTLLLHGAAGAAPAPWRLLQLLSLPLSLPFALASPLLHPRETQETVSGTWLRWWATAFVRPTGRDGGKQTSRWAQQPCSEPVQQVSSFLCHILG